MVGEGKEESRVTQILGLSPWMGGGAIPEMGRPERREILGQIESLFSDTLGLRGPWTTEKRC